MTTGWSNKVREIADNEYVQIGRVSGVVRLRLGDLKAKAKKQGLHSGRIEQVATAIESRKFWEPRGLVMTSPKGQGRRVDTVIEFKFVNGPEATPRTMSSTSEIESDQDPLLALVGTLKHAFSEGAEAFLREIRRDKEEYL